MRVLVGIPEQGSRGGPAASEPPFIKQLRRLGHQVEEEIYAYSGSESTSLPDRITRVMRTAKRFEERIHSESLDLIHINTSFDTKALLRDSVIVPRLHSNRARIFVKFHGSDAQLLKTRNPALALARRRLLAHADGIGVLSSEEEKNFLRAGVSPQKLFVVKNVVERNSHVPNAEFRRQMNLPADVPLLLFVGRFIPAKGLLDVIQACALLRDRGQEFLLLCIGDGPARLDAEALVDALSLQNQVRFFGYILEEHTAEFYANGAMLLFPTYHYEGFPMVIFNAAAAALPIITTRIRAAADYLNEPQNCLWVEPQDSDRLADNIGKLLDHAALRENMGKNNRQLVARFSSERVTDEYISAYEQIIGN